MASEDLDPETHRAGVAVPRRGLLRGAVAAAGVAAVGLTASPASAQRRPPRDPREPRRPWAPVDHTHDGGALGVEEPVAAIDAEVLRTRRLPTVDVAAFGAVGDGVTDDTAAIEAAIASMADAPGILAFDAAGAYRIGRTLTVDVAAVRGVEGRNARLVLADDIVALRVVGSHTGSANPTHPSSQRVKVPEMNPWVRDLRVHGADDLVGTALQIEGTFGLTVSGCHLFDLRNGIEIIGVNRNMILARNNVWHCLDYGIWWHGGVVHQTNMVGNHVSYCRKVVFIDRTGLYNLQIVGNALEASSTPDVVEHVVHAVAGDDLLEGIELVANSLEDHTSASGGSVRVEGGPGQRVKQLLIADNDFGNSRTHDVHVSDVTTMTVHGNSFDDSSSHAIRVSGRLTAGTITGNVFRGYGSRRMGMLLVDGGEHGNEVRGLSVTDNVADRMERPPVVVRDTALVSSRFSGNVVHYAGDEAGAVVDIGAGVTVDAFHLTGNTVRADGQDGVDGIVLAPDTARLLVVTENVVADVGGTALDLPEPAADVVVANNIAAS